MKKQVMCDPEKIMSADDAKRKSTESENETKEKEIKWAINMCYENIGNATWNGEYNTTVDIHISALNDIREMLKSKGYRVSTKTHGVLDHIFLEISWGDNSLSKG